MQDQRLEGNGPGAGEDHAHLGGPGREQHEDSFTQYTDKEQEQQQQAHENVNVLGMQISADLQPRRLVVHVGGQVATLQGKLDLVMCAVTAVREMAHHVSEAEQQVAVSVDEGKDLEEKSEVM